MCLGLFESLAETGRRKASIVWELGPQLSSVAGDFTDRGDEELLGIRQYLREFMETSLVFRC